MQNITFNFIKQGQEKGIEIHFAEQIAEQIFWSCKCGSDLSDFEALLQYCIPSLDVEQFTFSTMRQLEQKLYRLLSACKQKRIALKVFIRFCEGIEKKYANPKSKGQHNKIDYLLQEMEWKLKQMLIAVMAKTAPR